MPILRTGGKIIVHEGNLRVRDRVNMPILLRIDFGDGWIEVATHG